MISRYVALLLVVLLGACAYQGVDRSNQDQDRNQDSGPVSDIDLSMIPDIQPVPVARTKAGNYSPYDVFGKTYEVLPKSQGFIEEGIASWYGRKFHGRLTSNGERFDMYGMTAAHKHIPIPTYVEVTNLDNGLTAILRVNDRGPFHGDRVIDLSWAAAAKLGYADTGTARVRIVALDPDDPYSTLNPVPPKVQAGVEVVSTEVPDAYALDPETYYQVALLSVQTSAEALVSKIGAYTKFPVRVSEEHSGEQTRYRILIGPLSDRREMNSLGLVLELAGMAPGFLINLAEYKLSPSNSYN